MARLVILYRNIDNEITTELDAARQAGFICTDSRMDIRKGDLVVGRYSVLPFYREQARDIASAGAFLVNSPREHEYLADIREWYQDLVQFTPATWFDLSQLPEEGAPFVLKGQTNSMRQLWKTHMYAETKADAIHVASNLMKDSLVGQQAICIRHFERLMKIAEPALSGMPVSEEYRFFCAKPANKSVAQVLTGAFYWSNHRDDLLYEPSVDRIPHVWLEHVVSLVDASFFAIDVALDQFGKPLVVELNDGQMAGISENDPVTLYAVLAKVLRG